MNATAAKLIVSCLLLGMLAACNSSTAEVAKHTPYALSSPTHSPAGPNPTPLPTSIAVSSLSGLEQPLNYDDIVSLVRQFRSEEPAWDTGKVAWLKNAEDSLSIYRWLEGKRVVDWEGWVLDTSGGDASDPPRLHVYMSDPYTDYPVALEEALNRSFVDVQLTGFPGEAVRAYSPADRIVFSGTIKSVDLDDAFVRLENVEIVSRYRYEPVPMVDIERATIKVEHTSCWGSCPVYDFEVRADGTLVYYGVTNVRIRGEVRTSIDKDKVRMLFGEVARTDFFAMEPEKYVVDDGSETIITVTLGGKTATHRYYYGATHVSRRVVLLGSHIHKLIQPEQWIR